jgi:hypothetical protein
MLATCNAEGIVEGAIPGFASLARVSILEMQEAVQILSSPDEFSRTPEHEGRRIEVIQGGWRILNYERYRNSYQSGRGTSAERTRRYRSKKKETKKNGTNGTKDRVHKTDACKTSRSVTCDAVTRYNEAEVDYWNLHCGELPKALALNTKRLTQLNQRRKDKFWVEHYEESVIRVASSDWCNGKSERGWRATFDWMLQPDVVLKIMEGKYDNRTQTKQNQSLNYQP